MGGIPYLAPRCDDVSADFRYCEETTSRRLKNQLRGCRGQVAELADALDLGSSGATHPSSSLGLPKSFRAEVAQR